MNPPAYKTNRLTLLAGDCREILRRENSEKYHAVITDPPYGLSFMGEDWDHQVPGKAFWKEILRVCKPGTHLLAFGGTRCFHRLVCAIEDAGWEIRDTVLWLYGQGMPKSLDISKGIDKQAKAKRKVIGKSCDFSRDGAQRGKHADEHLAPHAHQGGHGYGSRWSADVTEPATAAAIRWNGWGTSLKPAVEMIVLARKPLSEKTVTKNVLKHGTGGINIDACRIPGEKLGRWPANVVLDPEAGALLDEQSGDRPSCKSASKARSKGRIFGGSRTQGNLPGGSGGASRFFYAAKASRKERGTGNTHPTVKPIALMRWLVRLITPPGGRILDPFAGSGTTLLAARREKVKATGIELSEEYCRIAAKRLKDDLKRVARKKEVS